MGSKIKHPDGGFIDDPQYNLPPAKKENPVYEKIILNRKTKKIRVKKSFKKLFKRGRK